MEGAQIEGRKGSFKKEVSSETYLEPNFRCGQVEEEKMNERAFDSAK